MDYCQQQGYDATDWIKSANYRTTGFTFFETSFDWQVTALILQPYKYEIGPFFRSALIRYKTKNHIKEDAMVGAAFRYHL